MDPILNLATLLLFVLSSTSAKDSFCPKVDDTGQDTSCLCDPGDNFKGWTLTCLSNNFELLFEIKYVAEAEITFQCGSESPFNTTLLQSLDLTSIQSFKFKSCPLPNTSYYMLLSGHGIEQLRVGMESGTGNFTEYLFQNISHTLKNLVLNNNKISYLPESIFNGMVLLKSLFLSDNNLRTLPEKILWGLPSLSVLDISNNRIDTLPETLFQGLFQLEKLYLYKNRLKLLPNSLFQSLVNLKVLDLADNNLIMLSEDIFVGLSQLIHVRLRGNWLETLPKELFNYTGNLKGVDLSLNRFMEPLPEELLFGLSSLENVSIHDSNLTAISENFFSRCGNITHMKLQNNALSELPKGIFRNNLKLVELDLNFNKISELPEDLFPNQKNLQKLTLFSNNLTSIPLGLFRSTRNIKTLLLGRNHITNASQYIFRDLPNIEKLDLSINNLSYFRLDFNEHIRSIDLSYNSLTEIPYFNWLQYLKIEMLNLEYNKLTHLTIPILYSTSKRSPSLNFGHNNIKTIDVSSVLFNDGLIKDLPSKDYESYVESTISLNPNPFLCDCRMFDFYNYLQKSNEAQKRSARFTLIQNFTCDAPPSLEGQQLLFLHGNRFSCDIDEGCSKPCKCYLRAKDSARVMDCTNKGLVKLPQQAPHNTSVLHVENNKLSRLDSFKHSTWRNLTSLYLDNNRITSLEGWAIPPGLVNLTLRGNSIEKLPPALLNYSSHTKGFRIALGENPWGCNCSTTYFKKWLTEHYQIVDDVKNVYCSKLVTLNGSLVRMSVVTIPDDLLCPVDDWPYKVQLIAVTTICVVLALLLFIVSVLYYRNKRTVIAYVYIHLHNVFMCFFNEEDMDEDKVFDAFVSYSNSDRDVALRLLEELENKDPHFKLCIHERNWLPGNLISWNIINSVQNSRRTILVISKEFLESMWFQVEFRTAYYQMLEDKIDRLIVIIKGELPPKNTLDKDLQYLLKTKTYLVWEEKWFWEKIKYAMPHKKHEIVNRDVLALKDIPDTKKVKSVENQIALLSRGKETCKKQLPALNGQTTISTICKKESLNGNAQC